MAAPGSNSTQINFFEASGKNGTFMPLVCYAPNMVSIGGLWMGENVLNYTMPLFLVQLIIIVIITRAIAIMIQPFRQPRYMAEIIGGFILGPAMLGRVPGFAMTFFPYRSLLVLESMSHVGLIYFIFAVGVEIESSTVQRTGLSRSLAFAGVTVAAAFSVGALLGPTIQRRSNEGIDPCAYFLFLGVTLSVTSLSGLARVLADLKLLGTDIGRLAISSASLVNAYAWTLMSLAVAKSLDKGNAMVAVWAGMSALAFTVACFWMVRPAVYWVARQTPEGEDVDELHACIILVGVMVASFVADLIGTHAIFGAFVFGVSVPNEPVGRAVVEKVEDLVEGMLLPLFYVFSGMRANIYSMKDGEVVGLLVFAVILGVVTKMGETVLAAAFFKMPLLDGLSLGILMNTKGAMELVILNIGKDKRLLGDQSFTVLMIMSVVVTALVSPIQAALVKPERRPVSYKRRTILWHNPDTEIRLLACAHNPRNVPAFITLLDASNPTKRSPIFVYALHLVELTGRSSAVLLASSANPKSSSATTHAGPHHHAGGRAHVQSDQIRQAFESYEQHAGGVSVQTLTAFSPYNTMHEDICGVAKDKHVALILLPFHKHRTVDGSMEITHPAIRGLNSSVFDAAPCSVGILVDRGFGTCTRGLHAAYRIAVLFIGGADDREALAYAIRMSGHPGVSLTVIHLVHSGSRTANSPPAVSKSGAGEKLMNMSSADNDCMSQLGSLRGREGVSYVEQRTSNAEETVAAVREMGSAFDLYIVGRGGDTPSPLTAGLTDFSECPELGPIGDLLASSDFASSVSVLVLKYGGSMAAMPQPAEGAVTPDSPRRQVKLYVHDDRSATKI